MKKLLALLLLLGLAACANLPGPIQRSESADRLAIQSGWKKDTIETDNFTLLAYLPKVSPLSDTLSIYVEGDGLAWVNSTTPAQNPTPVNPLALKLALLDPSSVYIARPCQFVSEKQQRNCSSKYWTSHRFAPEVILSISQAIDQLKQRYGAKQLILIGYSGGGAVAALVAAQRADVSYLITVAGNLDHNFWTAEQQLSSLAGSLNPADAWQALQYLPQTHFVGADDTVIGVAVARSYASRFGPEAKISVVVIPHFDHSCCWQEHWPALKSRACCTNKVTRNKYPP